MLLNDLVGMAADVPPMTAVQWAAWLAVGLILTIWHRRARTALVYEPRQSRPKSGVRPPSGVKPSRPAPAPMVSGDPFGELETMLEPSAGTHRTPGESPILSSAGSPILRATDQTPTTTV